MHEKATAINPDILIWARERSGLSIDKVASSFKKEAEEIIGWETGHDAPTYSQLEKLAYSLYHRPLAMFFFPETPKEEDVKGSFRTLPQTEKDKLLPDTLLALREAKAKQLALYELNEDINLSDHRILLNRELTRRSVVKTANDVRDYLEITIDQQKKWDTPETAFKLWRNAIENKGVYVFKRSFKQKDVFGFSLYDPTFPLIVINNSTSPNRQIFSLLHELAHLISGINGVTVEEDSYIYTLSTEFRALEISCNMFAAEFLVPRTDFSKDALSFNGSENTITALAKRYKVSKEVILRRLLTLDIIDDEYYGNMIETWRKAFEGKQDYVRKGGGGNYYYNKMIYLGDNYMNLAFSKYHANKCNIEQLAGYLDVNVTNVPTLESFLLNRRD